MLYGMALLMVAARIAALVLTGCVAVAAFDIGDIKHGFVGHLPNGPTFAAWPWLAVAIAAALAGAWQARALMLEFLAGGMARDRERAKE